MALIIQKLAVSNSNISLNITHLSICIYQTFSHNNSQIDTITSIYKIFDVKTSLNFLRNKVTVIYDKY